MSLAGCPTSGTLEAYVSGRAAEAERLLVEEHLTQCVDCRLAAAALGLSQAPETPEEAARLDTLALGAGGAEALVRRLGTGVADPARGEASSRRPRRSWRAALGLTASLAAAAAVVLAVRGRPSPLAELAEAQGPTRPLEGLLSGLPYAPFAPTRGPAQAARPLDRGLVRLLEAQERRHPDAGRGLAALYVLRGEPGDRGRAEAALAAGPVSAEVENDRAVLLLARGDLAGALEASLRALEGAPRLRLARFNHALALGGLVPGAARAKLVALSDEEPGSPLAAEARERAARLEVQQRDQAGTAGPGLRRQKACRALLAASTREQLEQVAGELAALPAASGEDVRALLKEASRWSPEELAAHGRRHESYLALRGAAMSQTAPAQALDDFAREAAADVLLAVPALQLAAYARLAAGQLRAADALQRRVLEVCRRQGCFVENEAIAGDELANIASLEGDLAEAARLQDRAEAQLQSVDAQMQLAELWRKKADRYFLAEQSFDEAQGVATQALQVLGRQPVTGGIKSAQASALSIAGSIAAARGLGRAAWELHSLGLALAQEAQANDAALELAGLLALDALASGRIQDGKAALRAESQRQQAQGQRYSVVDLQAALATLAEQGGDTQEVIAAARRGLDAAEGAYVGAVAALRVLLGRALLAQGHRAEGRGMLERAVADAERAARGASAAELDAALPGWGIASKARAGQDAAIALAMLGAEEHQGPAELLLPLDRARSAMVGAAPVEAGWEARLPPGSCLVAWLPSRTSVLRVTVPGDVRTLPLEAPRLAALVDAALLERAQELSAPAAPSPQAARRPAQAALGRALFAGLPPACARPGGELWMLAEPPLDRVDLTGLPLDDRDPGPLGLALPAGLVTSLSRLLAPEAAGLGRAPLFVHDARPAEAAAALPAVGAEEQALRAALARSAAAAPLQELTGARATPDSLLELLPDASFVHLGVHGLAGDERERAALLLSGDPGRLPVRDLARARLSPGARVVLSACHAASPGAGGLPFAFARAGAAAVVSAAGPVADESAGAWAGQFYAALDGAGGFVKANHLALVALSKTPRPPWYVVLK